VSSGEGSIVLIFWMHLDLVVPRVGIYEAEKFMARNCIDYLVYVGQWKAILGTCFIQVGVVDA